MSDLFLLNEFDKEKIKPLAPYSNENSSLSAATIFIKALNKVIEKIDEGIDILSKLKNLHGTILDRDEEDSELLASFVKSIDLAGKILDEFQKGTSILNENKGEVVEIFTELNQSFSMAKIKLSLFSITKDLKYADETKKAVGNALILFNVMKEVITETESK